MRYLPLLLANLRRKKIRTVLTIGSFAVALFLFGLLFALRAGLRQGIDVAGADRLMVMGTSLMQMLPLPYLDRLERIPGVEHVAHATWFGGVYQDPKNFFVQFAIDPERWRVVYPEYVVDEEQWADFVADRQGIVVGVKLAERFGWEVGDHVPLMPPPYLGDTVWDFNVRAIYHGDQPGADESQFWMQYDYIQENGPEYFRGIVGWYGVRVADPDAAAQVAQAIDEEFRNSANETRTQTESAFVAGWVRQMGNIEFLVFAIGSVVFFTLLLVTGNTMAIAVRERTNELAVLKAVGYSDLFVLGLVLAESALIAVVGGAIGLWLANGLVEQGTFFVIGSVIFNALIFAAGSTLIIMVVRRFTGVAAVLKAFGCSEGLLRGLVVAAISLVAALGGFLGFQSASGMAGLDLTQGLILLYLPSGSTAGGLAVALATGLVAGLLPAVSAMRLSVVDALRRV